MDEDSEKHHLKFSIIKIRNLHKVLIFIFVISLVTLLTSIFTDNKNLTITSFFLLIISSIMSSINSFLIIGEVTVHDTGISINLNNLRNDFLFTDGHKIEIYYNDFIGKESFSVFSFFPGIEYSKGIGNILTIKNRNNEVKKYQIQFYKKNIVELNHFISYYNKSYSDILFFQKGKSVKKFNL